MNVSMASAEVGPTEDVVRALLDDLVDPLLPTIKSYARAPPSLSQQQAIAKQVHAVVLICSYYLRKSYRDLEFLCFESFVKLVVILKPSLMAHMKLMHRSDFNELEDLENQLSLTEKAIMDACDISSTLDPSKDDPVIEGWPICKVAVMLVDSRKENCFLLCNSVTDGVYSVIEKDACVLTKRSEVVPEGVHISKRIRSCKKISKGELAADKAGLQQLAFSAVEEATGIDQTDLTVLESHVVYSLNKAKGATRFYLMQPTKFIKEDLQVPFLEVIKSLQSPLVQMCSFRWMMTPAVKYFHILPYAGILSDWLSREALSNSVQVLRAETETLMVDSSHISEDHFCRDVNTNNYAVSDSLSNDANGTIEVQMLEDNRRCLMSPLSNFAEGPVKMQVDNSPLLNAGNQDHSKVIAVNQRKTTTCKENKRGPSVGGFDVEPLVRQVEMVDSVMEPRITECGGVDCSISSHKVAETVDRALALVPSQLDSKYLGSLQATLTSKEDKLSRTALRVLLNKRANLCELIQNLQDEIAVCDKNIHMVTNGVEDDFSIKIQANVDGYKDVCSESVAVMQERTYQHLEEKDMLVYRRKRVSETFLDPQNPCQVLDEMCYKRNWRLPTYRVSPTAGGFVANVTLRGIEFGSEAHSCPREARDSAAAKMISKLLNE